MSDFEVSGPPPTKKVCLEKEVENNGAPSVAGEEEGNDVLKCEDGKTEEEQSVSKVPQEVGVVIRSCRRKRRKFAVLLSYNGKGYLGMQK